MKKLFECKVDGCDKSYTKNAHLKRHVFNRHDEHSFKSVFICPELDCQRHMSSDSNLRKHYNNVHRKLFSCTYCNNTFPKRRQLSAHIFSHTGVPPFRCDRCDIGCASEYELKRHQRGHKTHTCTVTGCNLTFDLWTQLRKHAKLEHPLQFACLKCNKVFKTKHNLKLHIEIHEDPDKREVLTCPHDNCPRFYFHKRNLTHHIQSSHLGKLLECKHPGCGRKLCTKQKLQDHMKLHSPYGPLPRRRNQRTKERKKRRDAGKHKRSVAVKLSGLVVPYEVEKQCLHGEDVNNTVMKRDIDIRQESDMNAKIRNNLESDIEIIQSERNTDLHQGSDMHAKIVKESEQAIEIKESERCIDLVKEAQEYIEMDESEKDFNTYQESDANSKMSEKSEEDNDRNESESDNDAHEESDEYIDVVGVEEEMVIKVNNTDKEYKAEEDSDEDSEIDIESKENSEINTDSEDDSELEEDSEENEVAEEYITFNEIEKTEYNIKTGNAPKYNLIGDKMIEASKEHKMEIDVDLSDLNVEENEGKEIIGEAQHNHKINTDAALLTGGIEINEGLNEDVEICEEFEDVNEIKEESNENVEICKKDFEIDEESDEYIDVGIEDEVNILVEVPEKDNKLEEESDDITVEEGSDFDTIEDDVDIIEEEYGTDEDKPGKMMEDGMQSTNVKKMEDISPTNLKNFIATMLRVMEHLFPLINEGISENFEMETDENRIEETVKGMPEEIMSHIISADENKTSIQVKTASLSCDNVPLKDYTPVLACNETISESLVNLKLLSSRKETEDEDEDINVEVFCGDSDDEDSFNSKVSFESHFVTHKREKPFKCLTCGVSFMLNASLIRHSTIHNGQAYKCTDCGKLVRSKSALKRHIETHMPEKAFKCALCDLQFRTKEHLLRHNDIHTNYRPFECADCGRCFRQKMINSVLVGKRGDPRLRLKNPTESGDIIWPIPYEVQQVFKHKVGLKKHISMHSFNESQDECEKDQNIVFKDLVVNNSLDRGSSGRKSMPMKSRHTLGGMALNENKCLICGKCFKAKRVLQSHIQTHTEGRIYMCNECGKSFNVKSIWQSHIQTHTEGRIYTCNECGKIFNVKRVLEIHFQTHTGDRPYKCDKCEKTFGFKSHLMRHMLIHNRQKPYKCAECGYHSRVKWNLKVHMENHIGQKGKVWKCPECDESFESFTCLTSHKSLHKAKEPHNFQQLGDVPSLPLKLSAGYGLADSTQLLLHTTYTSRLNLFSTEQRDHGSSSASRSAPPKEKQETIGMRRPVRADNSVVVSTVSRTARDLNYTQTVREYSRTVDSPSPFSLPYFPRCEIT
uniref:C2H2-type domain-containing protein n=1 Tax=Timema shepardi TaxID=629360 RepID=A0A7R9AY02_TIMSH|nr:unnamed protein product [Timema shepardi]